MKLKPLAIVFGVITALATFFFMAGSVVAFLVYAMVGQNDFLVLLISLILAGIAGIITTAILHAFMG